MTRITHITISILATLALTAVAATASAYESPNAAENAVPSPSTDSNGGTSINAILSESAPATTKPVDFSSPNAILGGDNVPEHVVQTSASSESTGFDWADAFIGAGGALALALFTAGAVVMLRRRRGPQVQPTT